VHASTLNAASFVILLDVTVEFAEWFQILGNSNDMHLLLKVEGTVA
jgi:hypothetical protein